MRISEGIDSSQPADRHAHLFAGLGEMRARCRAFDWGATPLGPIETWPASLRTLAPVVLASGFPSVLLWGPELIQLYNDAYVPLLGTKHPTGLGMPTAACWPEAWAFNAPIYERVRTGQTVTLDDQLYRLEQHGPEASADDVYLTISYAPVTDGAGGVAGILVTMVDTTAAVRARARLAGVFAQSPSFLAVLRGPDNVFELVNAAYQQIVGQGRDLLGQPLFDALPETRGQGFDAYLGRVRATGEPLVFRELPAWLQRTPGAPLEERFIDITYLPLIEASGRRDAVIAHGADVTEQVRARRETEQLLAESEQARETIAGVQTQLEEQAFELELSNQQLHEQAAELEAQAEQLQATVAELEARTEEATRAQADAQHARQRLRDVFEQAPVAVAVLTGPDHVYTVMSPRYASFIPIGAAGLGRPFREAVPETVGQGVAELMDRVYRTGEPLFMPERLVRLDRDGDGVPEDYWFDIGYQPLRDADGAVYGIASVSQDITAHVIATRELEGARAEAERQRAEAQAANQAKSEFLSTMSHELRTPLNAIQGYTELLALELRGPLTAAQREDLERVRRANQYLTGLVTDILNFARLEAGQVEYHLVDVELASIVGDLEPLLGPQIAAKTLTFDHDGCAADTPDEPHAVRADPEKLRQILLNLLTNAIKFTAPGGRVALACETDASAGVVRLRVSDTGRGIPAAELHRIFEPFVQVDRHAVPASQQGVGLGLAISRDLARGMGGDITVDSAEGRGATFTVSLRRAAVPNAAERRAAERRREEERRHAERRHAEVDAGTE